MSKIDRKTLKSYFQSGKIPTEEQFADLIDSITNLVDDEQLGNTDVNLSGLEINAIHRITLRETFDSPVAWTFNLTPGQNLSLANAKGEVLVEFMQDNSIVLHGLVIRPEEQPEATPESQEGTVPIEADPNEADSIEEPSLDTDSSNMDTFESMNPLAIDDLSPVMERIHDASEEPVISESSESNIEASRKVEEVDQTDAVPDSMDENCFLLPADTEWHNIPIDLGKQVSMHIKASVYELGQIQYPETEAKLVKRGNKSYSVKSSQKSDHGWSGHVDIRWNMGQNHLQIRSKKFMALGEVKCQIQDRTK